MRTCNHIFTTIANFASFLEANLIDPTASMLVRIHSVIHDADAMKLLLPEIRALLPNAEIIPVSAIEKFNVEALFKRIKELLPVSPPFFEKDALTDKPARFFVTEIIREKILLNYEKEVPYSVEVVVERFAEDQKMIRINATIYVERESQKAIIIGHRGNSLKKVGMEARKDIEDFFEKKVYLELFVKVEKDWRNKDRMLKNFGYQL